MGRRKRTRRTRTPTRTLRIGLGWVAKVLSIPFLVGAGILVATLYYMGQVSDPIVYLLTGVSIFMMTFAILKRKKSSLFAKGKKVSTALLKASRWLYMINSGCVLALILAPSLVEQTLFGVALSTFVVGIAVSTLLATLLVAIDRFVT